MRKLRDESGMTMVEVLIGAAIIGLSMQAFVAGIEYLRQSYRQTRLRITEDRQISALIASMRANISKFQVSTQYVGSTVTVPDGNGGSNTVDFVDAMLDDNNLPIAWDEYVMTTPQNCPDCVGRMGYVVQPFLGASGVYQVTLKVRNKQLFKDSLRTYKYVVNVR